MYNEFDENERNLENERLKNEYQKIQSERKLSIKAIIIYIVVSIALSFGIYIYSQVRYTDSAEMLAGIVVGNEITFTSEAGTNEYQEPGYIINMYGSVMNQYTSTIPSMVVEVTFYDESDQILGTTSLSKDSVNPGEIWVLNDELFADFNPSYITYKVGFDESSLFYTLINFLQVFVVSMAFFFLNAKGYLNDLKNFLSDKRKYIIQIFTGIALIYVVMIISNVLLEALGVTGVSQNEQTIQSMFNDDKTNIILLFLTLVVFTPVVEELVFRKALFGLLEPKFGYIVAIASSGLVFGLMHVIAFGDFIQSIPYIAMGLAFGYMYHYSGKNIIVTMTMHAVNNFVAFLMYVFVLSITLF